MKTAEEIQKEIDSYSDKNKRSFDNGFKCGYAEAVKDFEKQSQYKKITGFDSPSERKAYEEGYDDAISVCMDFIRNWKGTTNSGLDEMLYNKFIDWQKQQSK